MNSPSSFTLCLVIVIWTLSLTSASGPLVFRVAEEAPVGTVVGVVSRHESEEHQGPVTADRRYRMRSTSSHFDLDRLTGLLRTAEVLDREELCPYEPFCELLVDVVVTGTWGE